MTRKESREQAFVLLFEYSFTDDTADELFEAAREAGAYTEDEYCTKAVITATENIGEIDAVISQYAKGWKIERISKVALAALRLAVCEIKYFEDIPDSVSINEAVELVKKYASEQDAVFVNGILGTYARA